MSRALPFLNVRVLIVEDERKLAEILATALRAEHYDVAVAPTGEDGFFRANAEAFDLIVAMDRGHLRILERQCPRGHRAKLRLLVPERDVPDPYYGGPEGFEHVLDMVETACRALLGEIKSSTFGR